MPVYKPEKNIKIPVIICITCIVCGLTLFLLGGLNIGWRLGQQILALVLFVTAIETTTKFILTDYIYEISLTDGAPDLIVTKRGGNRSMAVCNIGADSVVCIERRGKLRDFEQKYGRMEIRYNYYSNLGVKDVVWIHFVHNDKNVLVAIEANEAFFAELKRYFPDNGVSSDLLK